ncbi:hypothetical protein BG004_003344 [Podila humilis]|nr:hypothetical protein BG004_003344 [Podila humilis]
MSHLRPHLVKRTQTVSSTSSRSGASMATAAKSPSAGPDMSSQQQQSSCRKLLPVSSLRPSVPPKPVSVVELSKAPKIPTRHPSPTIAVTSTQSHSLVANSDRSHTSNSQHPPPFHPLRVFSATRKATASNRPINKKNQQKLDFIADKENVAPAPKPFGSSVQRPIESRNQNIFSPNPPVSRGILSEKPKNKPVAARFDTLLKSDKESNQNNVYSITSSHLNKPMRTFVLSNDQTTGKKRQFADENQGYPVARKDDTSPPAAKTMRTQAMETSREKELLPTTLPLPRNSQFSPLDHASKITSPSPLHPRLQSGEVVPSIRRGSSPQSPKNEVAGSVEDEATTTSLDDLWTHQNIKKERTAQPMLSTKNRDIVDEVEDSEDSDENLPDEPTLPNPDFLLDGTPGEVDEIEASDISQTSVDDLTLPNPDFLLDEAPAAIVNQVVDEIESTPPSLQCEQLSEIEDSGDEIAPTGQSGSKSAIDGRRRELALYDIKVEKSSQCVSSAWCIDGFRNEIMSTSSSFGGAWLAIETKHCVQLWELTSRSENVWTKQHQHNKASMERVQVLFSEDDSSAVILDLEHKQYTEVPLMAPSVSTTVQWSGPDPVFDIEALLQRDDEGRDWIVMGLELKGSLLLVQVISGDSQLNDKSCTVFLHHPQTSSQATSLCSVQHASGMIASTFGTDVAIWKITGRSDPPVTTANISEICQTLSTRIVSAEVPRRFFQDYGDKIRSGAIRSSDWPYLVVLQHLIVPESSDDTQDLTVDQCQLYAMRGKAIQLVHNYKGAKLIYSVCASLRYLAIQEKGRDGQNMLRVWNKMFPNPVWELSLSASSIAAIVEQKRNEVKPPRTNAGTGEKVDSDNEDSCLSFGSTLSSAPEDISSSEENSTAGAGDQHGALLRAMDDARGQNAMKGRTDWIELQSVEDEEAKTQWHLQHRHRWMVVVQQKPLKQQQQQRQQQWRGIVPSSVSPSVHILDMDSLLGAA